MDREKIGAGGLLYRPKLDIWRRSQGRVRRGRNRKEVTGCVHSVAGKNKLLAQLKYMGRRKR